jgi:hypothetical protein
MVWRARKVDFSKQASAGVAAAPEQLSPDELATTMKAKAAREAQAVSEDEGSGKAEVWRVEDMDKVRVTVYLSFFQFLSLSLSLSTPLSLFLLHVCP